jgi:putative hemolysin
MTLSSNVVALTDMPTGKQTAGKYVVRFAQNAVDIDAALKLRFDVFNLELGEGLAGSFDTQRDEDPFDAYCHHLIVEERETQQVVGTYRMQSFEMAQAGIGFYSAGEYDFSGLPDEVVQQSIEVGRACIAEKHRNSRVLFLLWRGLAMYMTHKQKRFLFGCCSLTSQDEAEGNRVMRQLQKNGYLHPEFRLAPKSDYVCGGEIPNRVGRLKLPTLFKIYLDYGAMVCSFPAIDREFKTVDFLVMLDLDALDPLTRRLYFR